MKIKRIVSCLLVLCLLGTVLPMSARAAGTLEPVNIADTVVNEGYMVSDLNGVEQTFSYTVPEGGATVLVYFSLGDDPGKGFLSGLSKEAWIQDSNINVVAIEATGGDLSSIQDFIDQKMPGSEAYIDYLRAPTPELVFRYFSQTMEGTMLSWPFVMVITEDGGTKHIQSAGMALANPDTVRSEVAHLLDNRTVVESSNAYLTVTAAKNSTDGLVPVASHNNYGHNYGDDYIHFGDNSNPSDSALLYEQGSYYRIENVTDCIIVEQYDRNFKLLSRRKIPMELYSYCFGGIYICEDYNFLVFGDVNYEEDDSAEVVRVVRYSKDWERQAAASLYGANTVRPFHAGEVRFARKGNMLYIRTCHLMYEDENCINHQANMSININIDNMTVTDCISRVANISVGYVSHSFNQFVQVDGADLMYVDHGDGLPRSVVMIKEGGAAGQASFTGDIDYVEVLPIQGPIGENSTGVEVGSFEYSSTHYLVAGITCDQSYGSDEYERYDSQKNVFITATPKNDFTETSTDIYYLTDYAKDSGVQIANPYLVKIGNDAFALIWIEGTTLKFCKIDGTGRQITNTGSAAGRLSDCPPIVADGKIVWYVTGYSENDTVPVFYQLDLNAMDSVPGQADVSDSDIFRISGSSRCETAIAVANELKEELGVNKFAGFVVANGNDFADALAGSYLASQLNAPILLHRNNYIMENVEYIRQNLMDGGKVYVLGGYAAVPEEFWNVLSDALGEVRMNCEIHRLSGSNRFVTNLNILEEGGFTGGEILVCNSHNFADALSASATGKPILLVNNNRNELLAIQKNMLRSVPGVNITIVGGPSAVNEALAAELASFGPVTRIAGSNREATSVEVAKRYFSNPDEILLAYSRNFPDGLCGGPLAYAMGAPLLLTNARAEAVGAEYVAANGISAGIVLGGTAALSDATARKVFNLADDTPIPLQ